jgi:hypothetical protein
MESVGEWNWAIAVSSARYNAVTVQRVFSKWSTEHSEIPPVHEIIFCASNLAFATELYLKSACISCGGSPPPGGHKLHTIFNNIPRLDRDSIIEIYNENFKAKYEQLHRGEIWFKLDDGDLPKDKQPKNLMEVLDHYSCSYEDWRYVFAINKKKSNPSNLRCLHYSRLMCLCEATDQHLQNRFPETVRRLEITILK